MTAGPITCSIIVFILFYACMHIPLLFLKRDHFGWVYRDIVNRLICSDM